jgi:cytochrome c556
MKNTLKLATLPVLAMAFIGMTQNVNAQQTPKPEQLIKWRQSTFQVLAWNTGRIKTNVDGQYNKDEVIKASNTIAAIAVEGFGPLFAAGTESGKGWHETTTKPALFATGSKLGEYSVAFAKEATELANLAAVADQVRVKEQFGKLTRTCKTCHDDYKTKD